MIAGETVSILEVPEQNLDNGSIVCLDLEVYPLDQLLVS